MPIPKGKHTDWRSKLPVLKWLTWPLGLIPRSWTAFESCVKPAKLTGNCPIDSHFDVPPRGTWVLAGYKNIPVWFAIYTKHGKYFRIGIMRYDYIGDYWEILTAAYRNYK